MFIFLNLLHKKAQSVQLLIKVIIFVAARVTKGVGYTN